MANKGSEKDELNSLAQYLTELRAAKGMKLREVEEASDKEVSNAYLSQLEKGKIKKPSPNILHSLATTYGASYAILMEKAGYVVPSTRGAKLPKRAITDLTPEEEKELLWYLASYRNRKSEK